MLSLEREKTTIPLKCLLEEDKICDNCCDCFACDLDPDKVCDNCAKCLDLSDYNAILIDDIPVIKNSQYKGGTNKIK